MGNAGGLKDNEKGVERRQNHDLQVEKIYSRMESDSREVRELLKGCPSPNGLERGK
jgi:hypothetical protein